MDDLLLMVVSISEFSYQLIRAISLQLSAISNQLSVPIKADS